MKTSQIARGIVGALSLMGVIGAVGCGAVGPDGEYAEGEIGETSQALQLFDPSVDIQFSGSFKISSTQVLVIGGYDSTGSAVSTSGIFNPTLSGAARWQLLSAAIPTALGEVEVAPIPGVANKFLVVGGRPTLDGTAVQNTYILTLSGTNLLTANWLTLSNANDLATERVLGNKNLQKCGTSKLIAFGGAQDLGMQDIANMTALDSIEVFNYVAAPNEATSSWGPLKDGSNNTIRLQSVRAYPEVLHVSDTDFRIVGGLDPSATAGHLGTVDKLTVNSSCVAQNPATGNKLEIAAPLPNSDKRARFSSIAVAVTDPVTGAKTYEFIVAGGSDGAANDVRPVTSYLYNENGTTSSLSGEWVASGSMSEGRIFPRFVNDGTSAVLVTGLMPKATSSFDPYFQTSKNVDLFDLTPAAPLTGNWTTGTDIAIDRVGASFVERVSTTNYLGFGATHTSKTGTGVGAIVVPSSLPGDIETF